MSTDVVMPQMGESIAEGTIVRWIKKVGDRVDRDEPLFEISTDKVDAEIPSPAAGDGISASTLSVEISKSGSSRSTRSPTFLIQRTIVPSAIDSPIWGMTTSVDMFSPRRLAASPRNAPTQMQPRSHEDTKNARRECTKEAFFVVSCLRGKKCSNHK